MKITRLLMSGLALMMLGLCSLPAQPADAVQKELFQFLDQFVQDYVNLPKTRNKESFLRHFSKEVSATIYVQNIAGRSRVSMGDYAGLSAYLDNIFRANSITLGYDVAEKYVTYSTPDLATLVYKINYETKEENGFWVKGIETVTMALEKVGGRWLVVHYSIFQIEDEKLRGACLCEMFLAEASDGELVAKTTIPSGRSYATQFDNFEFRTSGAEQTIRTGSEQFRRKASGEVVWMGSTEEKVLGSSKSQRETALLILQYHLYKESCTRLTLR
jgi:hypothetical protein